MVGNLSTALNTRKKAPFSAKNGAFLYHLPFAVFQSAADKNPGTDACNQEIGHPQRCSNAFPTPIGFTAELTHSTQRGPSTTKSHVLAFFLYMLDDKAAGNGDHLAGHIGGFIANEEAHPFGNFFRRGIAAHRHVFV